MLEMAISDAYGAGFEYAGKNFFAKHHDLGAYVSHPKHRQLPGTYTDDTQMAMAVAELMLERRPLNKEAFADKFVAVFKRDPRKGYSQRFYWLLREVRDGLELLAKIRPVSEKAGAAMRAPPLGLFPCRQTVLELAALNASVTHATAAGIASSQASALLAHYLAYDLGPVKRIGSYLDKHIPGYGWRKPWRGVVGPCGVDAVHAAAEAISRSTSLAELLGRAVNFRGDVDTVAAIAVAAAANSRHFHANLPRVLVENLECGPFGAPYLRALDRRLERAFPREGAKGKA